MARCTSRSSLAQVDRDTVDLLAGSDVLLMVVNANSATTFASLAAQELVPDSSGVPEPEPELVLDELDTDFLNTELLQRLRFIYSERELPPIVVLISAWDSIQDAFTPPDAASVAGETLAATGGGALLPEALLSRVQPQLSQLVDEIARTTAVHVIGLSSTGGIKKDEPDLLSHDLDKRAYAIDDAGTRTHVAEWLAWFDGLVQ